MPKLVKLAHSDVSNASSKTSNGVPGTELEVVVEVSSRESTPIEAVQEKINKLESEIFKKIEALDKENESAAANVTKRKTVKRRNKSSTSSISSITSAKSPAKRTRTSKTMDSKESSTETKRTSKTKLKETKENKEIETKEATKEQLKVTEEEKPKRRGRKKKEEVPDKVNTPNSKTNDSKPASRSSSRLSKQSQARVRLERWQETQTTTDP